MINCDDRYCPIAKKEISSEVCYEVVMCLFCGLKASSVPEVDFEKDEETKKICDNCQYSDID